jgi:uncharacterized protein YneF (UPF0154 family)
MANNVSKAPANQDRLSKAAETILFLMVGQLAVGAVVGIFFALSFLASPLRPLVWVQLLAGGVLLLGGLFLVTTVVVRYRKELAGFFRQK